MKRIQLVLGLLAGVCTLPAWSQVAHGEVSLRDLSITVGDLTPNDGATAYYTPVEDWPLPYTDTGAYIDGVRDGPPGFPGLPGFMQASTAHVETGLGSADGWSSANAMGGSWAVNATPEQFVSGGANSYLSFALGAHSSLTFTGVAQIASFSGLTEGELTTSVSFGLGFWGELNLSDWLSFRTIGAHSQSGTDTLTLTLENRGSTERTGWFGVHAGTDLRMPIVPVPEPTTWALMLGGLVVTAAAAARRRRT